MGSVRLPEYLLVGAKDLFLDHEYPPHIQDIDRSDVVHVVNERSLELLASTALQP